MSKTAGCVFALGVCMVLAAACGDDEGGPATGENGGAAGAGGRAGSGNAGRAGAAGAGGALGGAAGVGGAPGGAGGSSAGAAGAGAGNGGSAGAGGDPDGGAPDGSTGPQGNCPAFPASALQIVPQTEQQIAIARVLFLADGSADVVIRNISPVAGDAGDTSFFIGDPLELCSGPANCAIMEDICDEAGFDLQLLAGEEATCNIDAIAAEGH